MKLSLGALTLLAALAAPPTAAFAGVSAWADNPGGRMRLAALPPDEAGRVRGAVEIEPAEGWITYWREPGEAGMPPQMTVAPESGLSLEALSFPPPRVFSQNGVRDIGYGEKVSLPFTAKAEGAARALKATVFIGICKEICVPFQAEFDVPLAGGEAGARGIVEAAEAGLPEAPSPGFHAGRPQAAEGAVRVAVTLPGPAEAAEFFLTGPDGYVYLDPVLAPGADGGTVATFTLDALPRGYALSGKTWRLLVKAGGRAMETPLVFD